MQNALLQNLGESISCWFETPEGFKVLVLTQRVFKVFTLLTNLANQVRILGVKRPESG